MKAIGPVNIYISQYGTHLIGDDSPMIDAPLTVKGAFDRRFNAGKAAAKAEMELIKKVSAAWVRGRDCNKITA